MATSTVTIDKVYFETLLRRAQFHTPGVDFTTPADLPTVTIPKLDHDSLLNVAREYANLRRNLYKGGVTDETLAILINDPTSQPIEQPDGTISQTTIDDTSDGGAYQSQAPRSYNCPPSTSRQSGQNYTYGRNDNYNPRNGGNGNIGYGYNNDGYPNNSHTFEDFSTIPDFPADSFFDVGNGHTDQGKRPHYARNSKRTIQLANLPDGATHADVTNMVRGGMLLDIYLRSNDRMAAVSFLEEDHAQDFFQYVKRNDLYIRGKRIEIRWNERQFILPSHVGNKIAIGATRNLVIRNAAPRHTGEAIRDDLEHIHNLVVIAVVLKGQNVHVSTNSVHNAMFARTCMMSRTTYKGSKIDWDVDECASPIPKIAPPNRKEPAPAKKRVAPVINRFELLNMDGTEESSEDELDNGGAGYQKVFPSKETGVTA